MNRRKPAQPSSHPPSASLRDLPPVHLPRPEPRGTALVLESGHVAACDDTFLAMWNLPAAQVMACSSNDLRRRLALQAERPDECLRALEQAGSSAGMERRLRLLDGRRIAFRSSTLLDARGRAFGRLWCFRDVTRSPGERDVMRQMALFAEYSPGIVMRVDSDGRILAANPVACEKLAPPVGAPLATVLPGFAAVDIAECIEKGATLYHTEQLGERCYQFVIRGVREPGVAQIYGMDVTELESIRQALAERAVELERSNADLLMFADSASHDLHEPLRTIAGFLRLLDRRFRENLPREGVELLERALDGAGRMQRLLEDLLQYARTGSATGDLEEVDTSAAFDAACLNVRAAIGDAAARVTRDPLPMVRGISADLVLLFQNLLSNALKFHGEKPLRVHCTARRRDGMWQFLVRDNGIGIEQRDLERVFGVFQRLHPADRYAGTGMGLAICKRIVERHGGRIWVESEPGHGSVFYFSLPAN